MAKSHAHILYYRQRFDILLFLGPWSFSGKE